MRPVNGRYSVFGFFELFLYVDTRKGSVRSFAMEVLRDSLSLVNATLYVGGITIETKR